MPAPPYASTPPGGPVVSPYTGSVSSDGPPSVTVGSGGFQPPSSGPVFTPVNPAAASSAKRRFPKKLVIPVVAALVILIGAPAFYFGYYMNPSVIYAQSLNHTGKGYDKLVTYADQESKLYDSGYSGNGSYNIKSSGSSVDGKMAYKSDGRNSEVNFDVGAEGIRVNADVRTIKNSTKTPDVYMKIGGLRGLGTALGAPDMDRGLAKIEGRWIVIDHTLIDSFAADSQTQADSAYPSREQVLDEARALGLVNQQYLFSTDKDKAVTEVVKRYGTETVDGHKTYHYKVALNKDNAKKYVLAQLDALKASKLNDWLKKNNYDKDVYASFNDAADSTKDIKSDDTFDVWMDVNKRMIYKVRFSDKQNSAYNYVDVGLNYKGGADYPFFVNGKSKDSSETMTYSFDADINTETNNTDFKLKSTTSGSYGYAFDLDFSLKPGDKAASIKKPAGAISLNQALSYLGFDDAFGPSGSASSGSAASLKRFQANLPLGRSGAGVSTDVVRGTLLRGLLER